LACHWFRHNIREQENEDFSKIEEGISMALGKSVSIVTAYRFGSKVQNKYGQIVTVLNSYNNN
jgi:hypothetical protein